MATLRLSGLCLEPQWCRERLFTGIRVMCVRGNCWPSVAAAPPMPGTRVTAGVVPAHLVPGDPQLSWRRRLLVTLPRLLVRLDLKSPDHIRKLLPKEGVCR